ncbi:MAG: hypothetical protein J5892_00350 [Bacilli bacterium]|nr:hypothetical protein [Bacilli bacterium]
MRRLIKKQIAFFSIIIILMVLSIASSSLAFFKSEEEAGSVEIGTGSFSVSMPSSASVVSGPIYPMSDYDATYDGGYDFDINNTGSYYYDYKVSLYIETPANYSGTLLDNQYIRVSLDGSNYYALSELSTRVVSGITYYDLYTDYISPSDTRTHVLYVWADEDTPNSEAGHEVYLSLRVEGQAIDDNTLYAREAQLCQFISNTYGNDGEIGAKYGCSLGDGITRNFYLLKKDSATNTVKLIMEQNLSDTVGSNKVMTWDNAIAFFNYGHPGYSTKQAWSTVINVDLPSAQDIMDASLVINPKQGFSVNFATQGQNWWCFGSHEKDEPDGPVYCPTSTAQQKAAWLFSYTRDCISRGCYYEYPASELTYPNGYWTKALLASNNERAWLVTNGGYIVDMPVSFTKGVRPVITIYQSNLY